jgi:hypothetical protein
VKVLVAQSDTELAKEFFEKFPDEKPETLAGWIGMGHQSVRDWQKAIAEGVEITIRKIETRKAMKRRLRGVVAESVAYAEGFLAAVRQMKEALEEIEGSILPPSGS